MAQGDCSECGGSIMKLLDATGYDRMQEAIGTNANLFEIDEGKEEVPVGVGTKAPSGVPDLPSMNDKIIHDWQLYAGRYDGKTVDAHLISIRDFDDFVDGQCFSQVRDKDVGRYRNGLLEKGELPREQGGLSPSTIRHRASHLAAFFTWLAKQEGYRRLSTTLPEYFALAFCDFPAEHWKHIRTTDAIDKTFVRRRAIRQSCGGPRGEARRVGWKRRRVAHRSPAEVRRPHTCSARLVVPETYRCDRPSDAAAMRQRSARSSPGPAR